MFNKALFWIFVWFLKTWKLLVDKKKNYTSKFKQEWMKAYPFISRRGKGDEFAKCCSCRMAINAAREGKKPFKKTDI